MTSVLPMSALLRTRQPVRWIRGGRFSPPSDIRREPQKRRPIRPAGERGSTNIVLAVGSSFRSQAGRASSLPTVEKQPSQAVTGSRSRQTSLDVRRLEEFPLSSQPHSIHFMSSPREVLSGNASGRPTRGQFTLVSSVATVAHMWVELNTAVCGSEPAARSRSRGDVAFEMRPRCRPCWLLS